MDRVRKSALDTLNRCFGSGAWSVQTLDSQIRTLGFDERDAAFCTWLVFGVIRNYALLDWWIEEYCVPKDLPVRNILRLGLFQIRFSEDIPDSAAVNECVDLCKSSGYKSASGLVNAVLRKAAKSEARMPDEMSVRFSQPPWLVERMISEHGREFTLKFLEANNKEAGIVRRTAFCPGEIYVQDEAAYQAVQMLNPKPGMRVLDSCSAPGGKSFTTAVMMENKGEIVACDIHEKKTALVANNAKRLGIDIISTLTADAREFRQEFFESFDAVIADVPCSGIGVIRKKPEIRFKTAEEIAGLPEIQRKILSNVSRYLKPGGKLLYSTCTVLKEENEDIVSDLKGFHMLNSKTFWPHIDGTDGFYAAVLMKDE